MYCTLFIGFSTALSAEQLRLVSEADRINHRRDSITGMLLYRDGEFMQVLEGSRRKVEDERQRIARDHRYQNVMTLFERYIAGRQFSCSSIAFFDLSEREPLGRHPFSHPMYVREPSAALELLLSYRSRADKPSCPAH